MKNNITPKELDNLAFLIGSFIEYWGFKRIHGEIWTHVWLSATPLDASTLVKRINVSKALISLAIKDLLEYDVVRTVEHEDKRKLLLVANPDVQTVISNVLKKRESKMLENILTSCELTENLDAQTKSSLQIDMNKLEAMKTMIQIAQLSLSTIIDTQLSNDTSHLKN